jgi:hypothetical protein
MPKIPHFFVERKRKKNCKVLSIGHNLTEFAKLHMLESFFI